MALEYKLTSGINIIIMLLISFEPIKLTFLLILDVNEGDEWPLNSLLSFATAVTVAQNASSKNNERPTTSTAICPIEIGGKLDKLYTIRKGILRSI